MNDKTLKIRIKLHSSGASPELPSIDPDEYERRAEEPIISGRGNSNRLPRIVGSLGVAALLLAGVYLFSKNDSDNPENIASGSSDSAENRLQISNDPSPLSAAQNAAASQRALILDDSAASKSQGIDDQPPSRTLAESASIEFSSDEPSVTAGRDSVAPSTHTAIATAASTDPELSEPAINTQDEADKSLSKHEEDGSKIAERSLNNKSDSIPSTFSQPHSEQNISESSSSQLAQVSRAQFTSGIKAREPIDNVKKTFYSDGLKSKRLYYFTELHGMKGDSIIHRWDHQGRTIANVTFDISGDRWRVYSSKNLPSSMKGQWNVVVTDASGNPLVSDSFIYD